MCPKRRQNLHLYCDSAKHTDDEQSIIHDYMVFQGVLRHCEKFKHWGRVILYPETYGFKGANTWSSTKDSDPVSAYYTSLISYEGVL